MPLWYKVTRSPLGNPPEEGKQQQAPRVSISIHLSKLELVTQVRFSVFKKKKKKGQTFGWELQDDAVSSWPRVRGQKPVTIGSSSFVGFRLCSPLPASLCSTAFSTQVCFEHIWVRFHPEFCTFLSQSQETAQLCEPVLAAAARLLENITYW